MLSSDEQYSDQISEINEPENCRAYLTKVLQYLGASLLNGESEEKRTQKILEIMEPLANSLCGHDIRYRDAPGLCQHLEESTSNQREPFVLIAQKLCSKSLDWDFLCEIFRDYGTQSSLGDLRALLAKMGYALPVDENLDLSWQAHCIATKYWLGSGGNAWHHLLFLCHIVAHKIATEELHRWSQQKSEKTAYFYELQAICENLVRDSAASLPPNMLKFPEQHLPPALYENITSPVIYKAGTLITVATAEEISMLLRDLLLRSDDTPLAINISTQEGQLLVINMPASSNIFVFSASSYPGEILATAECLLPELREICDNTFNALSIQLVTTMRNVPVIEGACFDHRYCPQYQQFYDGSRALLGSAGYQALYYAVQFNDEKWVKGALSLGHSTYSCYQRLGPKVRDALMKRFPILVSQISMSRPQPTTNTADLLKNFYEQNKALNKPLIASRFFDDECAHTEQFEHQQQLVQALGSLFSSCSNSLSQTATKLMSFLFKQYRLNEHPEGKLLMARPDIPMLNMPFSFHQQLSMLGKNFIEPYEEKNNPPLVQIRELRGLCYGMTGVFTLYALILGPHAWGKQLFKFLMLADERHPSWHKNPWLTPEDRRELTALSFLMLHIQDARTSSFLSLTLDAYGVTHNQSLENSFTMFPPLFWPKDSGLYTSQSHGGFYQMSEFYDEVHTKIEKMQSFPHPLVIHFYGQCEGHTDLHATALYMNCQEKTYYYFCNNTLPGQYCLSIGQAVDSICLSFLTTPLNKNPLFIVFQGYTAYQPKLFESLWAQSQCFDGADLQANIPKKLTLQYLASLLHIRDNGQQWFINMALHGAGPLGLIENNEHPQTYLTVLYFARCFQAMYHLSAMLEEPIEQDIIARFINCLPPSHSFDIPLMHILLMAAKKTPLWEEKMRSQMLLSKQEDIVKIFENLPHKHQRVTLISSVSSHYPDLAKSLYDTESWPTLQPIFSKSNEVKMSDEDAHLPPKKRRRIREYFSVENDKNTADNNCSSSPLIFCKSKNATPSLNLNKPY